MNHLMILSYIVTFLGLCLCAFSSAFMYVGRKIPGDSGEPQILKYRGIEVQTSSIIMLLLASLVVAVLPLTLWYLKPPPPEVSSIVPEPAKPLKLFIIGRVDDELGVALQGANVTLVNADGKSVVKPTESDGAFDFPDVQVGEGQRIKLTTQKDGYRQQNLILGVNDVNYPVVLARNK